VTVNEFVCRRIREFRIEKGLRVKDVAQRAEIPLGSYSCLEAGRYRMNLENLFRIVCVLGKEIADVWPLLEDRVQRMGPEEAASRVRLIELERPKTRVTLDDILDAVCFVYDLDPKELASPRRDRSSTEARGMAAILTSEQPHLTLVELGRTLKRDPSSLSHGITRLRRRLEAEEETRLMLASIRAMLEEATS